MPPSISTLIAFGVIPARGERNEPLLFPIGINLLIYTRPYVCWVIMALCTLIEVVRFVIEPTYDLNLQWGYIPGWGDLDRDGTLDFFGSLFTIFTGMFLHGGLEHLIGNMLFFFVVGLKLEDFLGHGKFLLFYLGCGVAANAAHAIISGGQPIPSIGASGAIAGCLGGFFMIYPYSKIRMLWWLGFGAGTFFIPAYLFLGFWFLKEFIFMNFFDEFSNVAFGAHVGGFFAGMLWMWAFYDWNYGNDAGVSAQTTRKHSKSKKGKKPTGGGIWEAPSPDAKI